MPMCKKCGNQFPNRAKINNITKNLNRRKYCLDCSPFGQHNTKQLEIKFKRPKSPEVKRWKQKTRPIRKKKLIAMKGGGCVICGYNRCLRALEFHHVDPETKKFSLTATTLADIGWDRILEEVKKTVLLCATCHREVEDGFHEKLNQEWKQGVA